MQNEWIILIHHQKEDYIIHIILYNIFNYQNTKNTKKIITIILRICVQMKIFIKINKKEIIDKYGI